MFKTSIKKGMGTDLHSSCLFHFWENDDWKYFSSIPSCLSYKPVRALAIMNLCDILLLRQPERQCRRLSFFLFNSGGNDFLLLQVFSFCPDFLRVQLIDALFSIHIMIHDEFPANRSIILVELANVFVDLLFLVFATFF